MNEALTVGTVLALIVGWTTGRIIGMFIIDRMDRRHGK